MPELPEVETVARDLRGAVIGRRVVEVELRRAEVVRHPGGDAFVTGLRGARIEAVDRRGKFIHCVLDTGDDLVVHLGMGGQLSVVEPAEPLRAHTHLVLQLDDGRQLRFADVRRFGRVVLGGRERLRELRALPVLGMEPLDREQLTWKRFDALLRRTTRTVKAALLDQRGVAGLGNIYVDEACHRAGVRPSRRCHTLTGRQRRALFEAIPVVLLLAVERRGSSIDDYRDLWDARGSMQEELQVYGRAGMPCPRCGTPLRRSVVAGRGTSHCPRCQR